MGKLYKGSDVPKLGFGLMRLPMNGEEIDMEQTCKMVDVFMEKGFTYFDTAYVYIGGKSEVALKEAVVDRYPRESFQTASKLPLWMCENKEDMERVFQESLDRAGLEYYDYYLLHAMGKERFEHAEKIGAWEFLHEKKAEGKIRNMGFSFHDSSDVLADALEKHAHETDFIQLQLNYIDWENPTVESKTCYELAIKHDLPVIVMEPIKGGTLAVLPPKAQEILNELDSSASAASWAMRYSVSLDNIVTSLSGMSTLAQVEDNVSYMKDLKLLNDEERAAIEKVVEVYQSIPTIPCTKCKYCVDDCPQKIDIPEVFDVMNFHKKFNSHEDKPKNMWGYENATKDKGKAADCIACGMCEGLCPQHIEIINELQEIAKLYDN